MNKCVIIEPRRNKGEPELPAAGILAANPSDVPRLRELAAKHSLKQHFLFHSGLYSSDHFFLAGPAVGAPMAVMCLEKLIVLGAKDIILYGWCGSLVPALKALDVLVPTWAMSEEGTSVHYESGDRPQPDTELRNRLSGHCRQSGFTCSEGPVWTTDAPYRETRAKIQRYGAEGIVAVDMEYSALCTVAAYRGVRLAALMLVSDELWRSHWQPQYSRPEFRARSGAVLRSLCSWMKGRPE